MKKEAIVTTIGILLVLGIQIYMLFQFNDRIKQAQNPLQINSDSAIPKPISDVEFFKDQFWSPYEEMQQMQNEMQKLFSDSYSRFHMNMPLGGFTKIPDVDLQEKPDQYIITMNAPGIDLQSLVVKLDNQVLHISIKTEHATDQTDDKNGEYRFRERFAGELHRMITLPKSVNAAKIDTSYENGILTIKVPKT